MSDLIQGCFPHGFASQGLRSACAYPLQNSGGTTSKRLAVPEILVGATLGKGRALPASVQSKLEKYFDQDLSNVRVHEGEQAASIGARAFTTGNDIYFARRQYKPFTADGLRLLVHEVVHVLQQRHGRVSADPGPGLQVVQDSALEAEADFHAGQFIEQEYEPGRRQKTSEASRHRQTQTSSGSAPLHQSVVQCLPDDPDDPASHHTYAVLDAAEAQGLAIRTTLLESPTLRPRDIERAALSGTLTNFGQHPGSTFLGTIGEALIIHNLTQQSGGGLRARLSTAVLAQPGAAALPEWARSAIGNHLPDLLVTQAGFSSRFLLFRFEQRVVWRNTIGPQTGGRVGSIDHGPRTIVSLWEVTVSRRFGLIEERAHRVAAWARILSRAQTGQVDAAAVLAIDRGAFFQLSAQEQATLTNIIIRAGGYISLFRDLTRLSLEHARSLAAQLRGQ